MKLMKWFTVIALVYIIAVPAQAASTITLRLAGSKLGPEIRVIEKRKVKYINLPFVSQVFRITSDWNPVEGNVYLRFGSLNIKMREKSSNYTVNGSPRKLKTALFEQGGELWLPVEFILRLGLVIKSQGRNYLNLDWEKNYFLGIHNIEYHNRPAFLLLGARKLILRHYKLTRPDRLVVELAGTKAHFSLENIQSETPLVKKVRIQQIKTDTTQIVFDLDKPTGYKIITDPEQASQAQVVFNYTVEGVSFWRQDQETKIFLKTTFPADFQVKTTPESNLLTVDLNGATLADGIGPFSGDGRRISDIHLTQINPDTVRVVCELLTNEPWFVIRDRDDPNLVQIRTLQKVTGIHWEATAAGGRLTITSEGELVETIHSLHNPERLQIDLQYAQFTPDMVPPEIESEQVQGIHLVTVNPSLARIELDLAYFTGYQLDTSADRRRLTLNFRVSPLIGKRIIVDAGHGGIDFGASGRQGTREKNINLEVALRLKDLLEGAGAVVFMTRPDDTFISLYERPYQANYLAGDLFISVHTNNHPDRSVKGIEVFYYPGRPESQRLARNILESLTHFTGFNSLGVKTEDFVVIRETQMPSILLELGFLSNFQEESIIMAQGFKETAAWAIFQGILNYCQD
ncbi:MAG: N-acetylmuramoyl-L-alanine amidase family protein [Firmicutes bacterium]|nr:N-acetylmuramoyl-L-alanine amidase family protein [Bacillota bacterium]